jgi:hypothetical protein
VAYNHKASLTPDPPQIHELPDLPGTISWNREFQLLIACSWVPPGQQAAEYAERVKALCSDNIDWNAVIALVDRHRVPALAYAMLRKCVWDRIPVAVQRQLKDRDRNARMAALNRSAELLRLAKMFYEEKIDLLALKGPVLSVQLYSDLGMRQSNDIDLLVKGEDLDRAARLLLRQGYECTFPDFELTAKQRKVLQSACHHYCYRHLGRSVNLELHWRFALWMPEHVAVLWKHSQWMEWSGARFLRPNEEMSLLILCDHGAYHQWFRIKWLGDVAVLLTRCSGIDWMLLLDLAERLDLQRPLAQAALLAHWCYGIPLAEPLQSLIGDGNAALARPALRALVTGEREYNCPPFFERWRKLWYFRNLRTRFPYRHFLRVLFLDTQTWKFVRLPNCMFWLYSLLRITSWAKRFYKTRLAPH